MLSPRFKTAAEAFVIKRTFDILSFVQNEFIVNPNRGVLHHSILYNTHSTGFTIDKILICIIIIIIIFYDRAVIILFSSAKTYNFRFGLLYRSDEIKYLYIDIYNVVSYLRHRFVFNNNR